MCGGGGVENVVCPGRGTAASRLFGLPSHLTGGGGGGVAGNARKVKTYDTFRVKFLGYI